MGIHNRDVLIALQAALVTNPDWLGKGRDVTPSEVVPWMSGYNKLEFVRAWQVQNDVESGRYDLAKIELGQQVSELPEGLHQRTLKTNDWSTSLDITMDPTLNECIALHGTNADVLGQILAHGLDEHYSGRCVVFGNGTYLAEDAGKADQYCKVDVGGSSTLHKALYPEGTEAATDVCYLLVCKVLLGESAVTTDGSTKEGGGDLWADPQTRRELGPVPGSDPPFAHHSLLVETGDVVTRYREIVLFHHDKALIKYIIAYRRTSVWSW